MTFLKRSLIAGLFVVMMMLIIPATASAQTDCDQQSRTNIVWVWQNHGWYDAVQYFQCNCQHEFWVASVFFMQAAQQRFDELGFVSEDWMAWYWDNFFWNFSMGIGPG